MPQARACFERLREQRGVPSERVERQRVSRPSPKRPEACGTAFRGFHGLGSEPIFIGHRTGHERASPETGLRPSEGCFDREVDAELVDLDANHVELARLR